MAQKSYESLYTKIAVLNLIVAILFFITRFSISFSLPSTGTVSSIVDFVIMILGLYTLISGIISSSIFFLLLPKCLKDNRERTILIAAAANFMYAIFYIAFLYMLFIAALGI